MEKHRMRYGNNKQRNASARVDAAPKGTDCFGSRKLLKHANEVSELLFVLCIALIPQSGDSSGAILEVPFKALLHLPHARNERTLERMMSSKPENGFQTHHT